MNKPILNRAKISQFIKKNYKHEADNILLEDGFDEAFLGIGSVAAKKNIAVYDRAKCIEILERDMSSIEAKEYFNFNNEGKYVGEYTPMFLNKIS
jgi:hypothetical protein